MIPNIQFANSYSSIKQLQNIPDIHHLLKKSGGQQRRNSDEQRRPQSGGQRGGRGGRGGLATPRQHPQSAGAGGRARPGALRQRGGLARGGTRQALARPKQSNPVNQQRTIRLFDKKPELKRQKSWHPSDKRLKVRNFDDKQVTNDDLKKLFAKIGEIKICKFDRNEFGQFLGSATVTYDRAEHAKQAIEEYNGAFLDEKVLVVEPDIVADRPGAMNKPSGGVQQLQKQGSNKSMGSNKGMGKTLNIQHNR